MNTKYKNVNDMVFIGYGKQLTSLSARTKKSYAYDIKSLREYLVTVNKSAFALSDEDEEEKYVDWLKNVQHESPRSIKRRLCTLRGVVRYCMSQKRKNDTAIPCEEIPFARNEDIRSLYLYCSNLSDKESYGEIRAKIIVIMCILFGLKPNDLSCMDIDSINGDEIVINSNHLLIRLINDSFPHELLAIYLDKRKKYLGDTNCNAFFLNRFRERLNVNGINRDFHMIAKKCCNENITMAQVRNNCICDYYDHLPDKVIICKLFKITTNRIDKLIRNNSHHD